MLKFYGLAHTPSGDKRWAVREAAGRIDRNLGPFQHGQCSVAHEQSQ